MPNKTKINLITLGCSKNVVDSERLLKQLEANNFELSEDPLDAEAVIINTCGFIDAAKEESINTILNAVALKKKGKIKKVIVSGCLSERYANDLKNEIPEVDAFFGTEDYEEILNEVGGKFFYNLIGERLITTPSHIAYLKISEGCNNPCSFCAIPLMRGLHKSKPIDDLIKEAKFLARKNVKEIILIGQDTTDYGIDIYGKRNISELIKRLSDINGLEWIRLMYAYPSHFPEDLINEINSNPKVCKYIDLPLQHISDDVLKSMRRGITKKRTIELLYKLREKISDLVLRTTFIVGYPAETEKHFEELLSFVDEFKFERLGVFTFSIEENTVSYLLGDSIPKKIKVKRQKQLMKLQEEISYQKNLTLINKKLKVILDSKEADLFVARSYREAPEVDGEILISYDIENYKIGNFFNVEIFDCNEHDIFAKFIK